MVWYGISTIYVRKREFTAMLAYWQQCPMVAALLLSFLLYQQDIRRDVAEIKRRTITHTHSRFKLSEYILYIHIVKFTFIYLFTTTTTTIFNARSRTEFKSVETGNGWMFLFVLKVKCCLLAHYPKHLLWVTMR